MARLDSHDVYVSEGVLLEVHRGAAQTVARQFGVDWDGQTQSMLHPEALIASPSPALATRDDTANARRVAVPSRWYAVIGVSVVLLCGFALGVAATLSWFHVTRGW